MEEVNLNCVDLIRFHFFSHLNQPNDFVFSLHRYWLFGEKVNVAKQKKDANGSAAKEKTEEPKPKRIRGWFPRNCAVELVNPESDDEHEHFTAKKSN